MLGLIFCFGIVFATLTFYRPEWAMLALAALLPTYGIRFAVLGVPSTLLEVLIWSAALGWFVREWRFSGAPKLLAMREALGPANVFSPYLAPIFLWIFVS